VRILVVAQDFPWPTTYGLRIRLANVVAALAEVGDVDLFTFAWRTTDVAEPPSRGLIHRSKVVPRPRANRTTLAKLAWLLAGEMPSYFHGRQYGNAKESFARWAQLEYDLIWYSRVEPYVAFGRLVRGPAIVDIDDLIDWRITKEILSRQDGDSNRGTRSVRDPVGALRRRKDISAWRRLQRSVADSVAAAVVCSDVDRRRLGAPNTIVIPNGYESPSRPLARPDTPRPPTVLLQGTFVHEPNADAASYLVNEIAPLLHRRVENVQIRLVGKTSRAVQELADPPRVVVTGFVPDIGSQLTLADVIAVPLRHGSGTRIKVLEAFAHKIPVVTTTFGVEGLDVTPGRHVLVADSPDEFAAACARLLRDTSLRSSLADAAYARFLERYQWRQIRSKIAHLATKTARNVFPAVDVVRIEP
jgi:glycosyltransferase involved in cell wall biosynthesis